MLSAGAYVTLEHEYILVLRKGGKRQFKTEEEKRNRRERALFWEERNVWFSDIWYDIKGIRQQTGDKEIRKRSGAFPFELAYRLINMYSVKEGLILDPFLGMGTTALAAMVSGRNSIGYEIDPTLVDAGIQRRKNILNFAKQIIHQRLQDHLGFIKQRLSSEKSLKHKNAHYGFPVMTAQERELLFNDPVDTFCPRGKYHARRIRNPPPTGIL